MSRLAGGRRELGNRLGKLGGCFEGDEVAGGGDDGEVHVGEVGHEVAAEHVGRLHLIVFSRDHEHGDVDLLCVAGDVLRDAVQRPFGARARGVGP